jgi:hypothetical protein
MWQPFKKSPRRLRAGAHEEDSAPLIPTFKKWSFAVVTFSSVIKLSSVFYQKSNEREFFVVFESLNKKSTFRASLEQKALFNNEFVSEVSSVIKFIMSL